MENRGTLAIKIRGIPFPIEFGDWTHDRLYHTIEMQGGDQQELQAFIGALGSTIPGGVRGLTEVDTNIPRTGDTGLQEGWECLVYSIQIQPTREMITNAPGGGFQLQDQGTGPATTQWSRPVHVGGFDPAALANGGILFDFMRKTYHRFTVNQKVQSEGPVEKYPQGSGMSVFATTTSTEVANNGVPSPRDQSAFVLPIWIRPNIAYVSRFRPQATLGITGALPGTVGGYFDWAVAGGLALATANGFDVRVTLEGLLKRPVV